MQRSAAGLQIVGICSSDSPDFRIQFLITLPRVTTEWSKADGLTHRGIGKELVLVT